MMEMGGTSITVSLRQDEITAIQKEMSELEMSRHELIKYALRRFLFPEERTRPLNGRHVHESLESDSGHRIFIVANGEGKPDIQIGGKPE